MKIAYEYRRISKEDQSNFSLSGQDKINREYAEKHGIQILKTYVDDGVSAKDFDRPEWRKLEADLSRNRGTIDYLIVSKYDRLIRNAAEGLAFIEKLEEKWNIKLLSVMENFFVDPHSPFFFKMRADMLVQGDFERRVISERSRFGMWSARSQGRFIGRAPFGYQNARDADDKPIIVVDEVNKKVIQQLFLDFLDDVTFPVMIKKARENGFSLKGHDALKRALTNHAYAGLIQTKSYKDNAAKLVKSMHAPIIEEDIFWRAYYKLNGQIRPQGRIVDDKIPLRGYILCTDCGHTHTGAKSKGKSSYYYYYWCKQCEGRGQRHSAITAHKEISQILTGLSLEDRFLQAIKEQAMIQLDSSLEQRKSKTQKAATEYADLKKKLNSLEEKYISDKIDPATYDKWFAVFNKDMNSKGLELKDLSRSDQEVRDLFNKEVNYLSDLNWLYNQVDVPGKQLLLSGIFPYYLVKEKIGCRTPYIINAFKSNVSKTEGLLRIEEMGNPGFVPKFPISRGNGNEVEHLLRIISKILKAA